MSREEAGYKPLFTKLEKQKMYLAQTGWIGWLVAVLILFQMLVGRKDNDLVMILTLIALLNGQIMVLSRFLRQVYSSKK